MNEITTHSLKVLDGAFEGITKADLEMIRILLSHLTIIREYKNDMTSVYINGLMNKNKLQRYMVIYLAIATLMKKDNRRAIKRFTKVDLQVYNRKLFRKMVKINQLSYDHFKNISNFNATIQLKEVL